MGSKKRGGVGSADYVLHIVAENGDRVLCGRVAQSVNVYMDSRDPDPLNESLCRQCASRITPNLRCALARAEALLGAAAEVAQHQHERWMARGLPGADLDVDPGPSLRRALVLLATDPHKLLALVSDLEPALGKILNDDKE